MDILFRQSFIRDLKKIKDRDLLHRIRDAIHEVENTEQFVDLTNLTKMSGSSDFYRIRIGDYRIGIFLEHDTVEFVRCLHRRDIYRYFP